MPVETAEDRAVFVSANDFGVTALYSQNHGPLLEIDGILDRQFLAVEAAEGAVTGAAVTFTCRSDDLTPLLYGKARQGDRLTIGDERWRVVEPQPDGTGMVVLVLQKD